MTDKYNHNNDPVWLALDSVLTEILGDVVKESVLRYFEIKHEIVMNNKKSMKREEIVSVLEAFFGTGGNLILTAFEKKLREIGSQKIMN